MEHIPTWARPLAWCLHAVGLLLCLAPLVDLAAGVGSVNPEAVPWRFGAAGLLSGALVLPMLGLCLVLVAAVVLDQLGLIRVLGGVAVLLFLVILAITVSFALDALQVRGQIRQEAKPAFDLATLKAAATYALEAMVLLVLGLNARTAARHAAAQRGNRKQPGAIVVPKGSA